MDFLSREEENFGLLLDFIFIGKLRVTVAVKFKANLFLH